MIFLLALIPATALTVAGYVALFLSQRSEGALRTFGRYLGFWAFALAALVVLGGMFAAGHMHRAHAGMWDMHDRLHRQWMQGPEHGPGPLAEGPPPAGPLPPPPAAPAPAAPAAPASH